MVNQHNRVRVGLLYRPNKYYLGDQKTCKNFLFARRSDLTPPITITDHHIVCLGESVLGPDRHHQFAPGDVLHLRRISSVALVEQSQWVSDQYEPGRFATDQPQQVQAANIAVADPDGQMFCNVGQKFKVGGGENERGKSKKYLIFSRWRGGGVVEILKFRE